MNKKAILVLAIVFVVVTLILNNVLETTIGGWLMTISSIAFPLAIIGSVYYLITFLVKQSKL
ncbi:MAG: hypothetical protein ACQEV0_01020 [Bacillota bacterium]